MVMGFVQKTGQSEKTDTQGEKEMNRKLLLVCVSIAKNRLCVKSMIPDFERGMMPILHIV